MMNLLLAAALVASPDIPLATTTDRLDRLVEDSKLICWEAVKAKDGQVAATLNREALKRGYTATDKVILGNLCLVYVEGYFDGAK